MAVHRHTKKHSSKKSTHKESKSTGHGKTMKSKCLLCSKGGHKSEVEISDLKEVTFKVNGHTRKRLVGKCEYGHKFSRFIKS
jgi:hypothetical protein